MFKNYKKFHLNSQVLFIINFILENFKSSYLAISYLFLIRLYFSIRLDNQKKVFLPGSYNTFFSTLFQYSIRLLRVEMILNVMINFNYI